MIANSNRWLYGKIRSLLTEGHHPDISFGWGYVTVGMQTKKIKGLHENDFIMAAKIDRLFERQKANNPERL